MKIQQMAILAGVPAKSLRFYEEEGLVRPGRNSGNGYREYTDADLARVERVKLMRKLGVPLAEIRAMTEGRLSVSDVARRHAVFLERSLENLAACRSLCRLLEREQTAFDGLDARKYLIQMEQLELGGVSFMDAKGDAKQKRIRGAFAASAVFIAFMLAWIIFFITMMVREMPPVFICVVLLAVPAAVIVGIVLALKQRIKEIEGGEEDAADQY